MSLVLEKKCPTNSYNLVISMKKSCMDIISKRALIQENNIFTLLIVLKINHTLGVITWRILASLHII